MNFPNRYEQEFKSIFKISLRKFYHPLFGFEIIEFDKRIIKTPDNESMQDYILKNYGDRAVELMFILIKYT